MPTSYETHLGIMSGFYSEKQRSTYHRINVEHMLKLQNAGVAQVGRVVGAGIQQNLLVSDHLNRNMARGFEATGRRIEVGMSALDANMQSSFRELGEGIQGGLNEVNRNLSSGFNALGDSVKAGFSATNDNLIRGFDALGTGMAEGFDRVSRDLSAISDTLICGVNGLADLIYEQSKVLDQVNDSLDQIVRVLENPAATNALEKARQAEKLIKQALSCGTIVTHRRAKRLFTEAADLLDEANERWGFNPMAHFNRGWLYAFVEQDAEAALDAFETALIRADNDDLAYCTVLAARHAAAVCLETGDFDTALEYQRDAYDLAKAKKVSGMKLISYDLARCCYASGETSSARDRLIRLLQRDANFIPLAAVEPMFQGWKDLQKILDRGVEHHKKLAEEKRKAEEKLAEERREQERIQRIMNFGKDRELILPDGRSRLQLKWIEPGSFMKGSPESERGRYTCEDRHEVALSEGYWLGETPVTQRQWVAVMGDNPSCFTASRLDAPVERVSWEEAMDFCRKLTARERSEGRLPYTLPTEAQWEYACRAGTTGAYAGDLDSMGWYDKNSGGKTHPVSTKRANGWGLYDMHGNVWYWCLDWYGDYPSGRVVDPAGASSGSSRVSRGGGWGDLARFCRSASRSRCTPGCRSKCTPGCRSNDLGFRPALSVNP